MKRTLDSEYSDLVSPEMLELKLVLRYPIVLLLTALPDLVDRLVIEFTGMTYFPLLLLHLASLRLVGFITALVFRRNTKIKIRKISSFQVSKFEISTYNEDLLKRPSVPSFVRDY